MPAPTPHYEITALRYAHTADRTQGSNLIFPDDHAAPMPLDYFIWAIQGEGRTLILDTGFDHATAIRRNRTLLRSPLDALRQNGIDPADIHDVVLSHMHFDHAGNLDGFPNARFHLQEAEMHYCTGRCMCHEPLRRPFDVEHVVAAIQHLYAQRLVFHAGTSEIAPGITLHLVGGHSGGLQIMRVPTARGWVVLASDATHFWFNIRRRSPFVLLHNLEAMLEGWVLCEKLADSPDHIIPGHDPEVTRRFPKVPGDSDAVRLDLAPIA
jgi:glyoxylase-like metal-dependent hydrolase (beta-lactamase superfamily II)